MPYRTLLTCLIASLTLVVAACSDDDDHPWINYNNNNNNRVPGECNDGIVQASEECDDGAQNSDTEPNACRTDCRLPWCGDGVVDDLSGEECDPPGRASCDSQCLLVTYTCDDASTLDPDCANAPTGQYCWDGGTGGELFCGCNPERGNLHCELPDTPHCDRATRRCEAEPTCGLDTHEPNDSETTAFDLELDASATGVLCHYDPDWFTFTTDTEDATVTIACNWSSPYDFNLDLTLTTCDGSVIASTTSSATDFDDLLLPNLPADTDYCLEVTDASGGLIGMDVAYSLRLDSAP